MSYRFRVWVRINGSQTATIYMMGDDQHKIQALCESQYGAGNVISVTYATESE